MSLVRLQIIWYALASLVPLGKTEEIRDLPENKRIQEDWFSAFFEYKRIFLFSLYFLLTVT